MNRYAVRYVYGTYSGTEYVWADSESEAIAKAKRRLRSHMTLPMACEHWEAEEA